MIVRILQFPLTVVLLSTAAFAGIVVTEPKDGATVSLLTDAQKAYLAMPRADRRTKVPQGNAYCPKAVRLAWTAEDGAVCTVSVKDAKTGACVYEGTVKGGLADVDNLEIAAEYEWTVSRGDEMATSRFKTEDTAPRLVRFPGVPNARDLGGRIGLGGKRVKQGMIFRSARLSEDGEYICTRFGIKSDVDLRSDRECHGMKGSPLGESVTWFHCPSSAYAEILSDDGKEAFKKVFKVFLDRKNYPLVFHCAGGRDRAGTVAFVLNALLGVEKDQLYLDWRATGLWDSSIGYRQERRFDALEGGFVKNYPAPTVNESVEKYVLSLGFTSEDIAMFRGIML